MKLSYNDILEVVTAFYAKASKDILIGFHFRNIEDFDTHIPRIAHFWEIQILGKTSVEIVPPFDLIKVHMPLKINPGQLNRWIFLFEETIAEFRTRDGHHVEDYLIWKQKLHLFRQKFLSHPALFSHSD